MTDLTWLDHTADAGLEIRAPDFSGLLEGCAEALYDLVCDRAYLPTFRSIVREAEHEIAIAQWELFEGTSTTAVVNELGDAVGRGVHVRVMLDETIDENADALDRLLDLGVDARFDGSTDKLHAKLVIGDDRVLAGSTNWSTSSISYNRECNLEHDPGVPGAYIAAWYDGLWDEPDARVAPDLPSTDGVTTALVDDDLLPALLAHLEGAEDRVDFTLYATYLQTGNPDAPAMQVFGALADAAARGVPVRGVADWSDWNPSNNDSNEAAVNWLSVRGVEIRWDRPSVNMHAKTFGVDDIVQVQSANVSTSGFETNREVGGWTRDPDTVDDFDAWFEELWQESTPEEPS